jgi:flavin reductase (DIM6/NTAB) family NADH-FMN oxidoreductase RutF
MFYRPDEPHGLRGNPLNAIVVPRPIGWIASLAPDGSANLAPYSFFNAVAYVPPQVIFAATGAHERGGLKDSVANIEATKEFVVNLATWDLREAMNASSIAAPHGFDEFVHAGLTKAPSVVVRPPRVAESPVHLECVLAQIVELESPSPQTPNRMVIGHVVGIHIADHVIAERVVQIALLDPIARLGYNQFTRVREAFAMTRPRWPEDATPHHDHRSSPS